VGQASLHLVRITHGRLLRPAVGPQRGNGHDPVLLQQREYLGSDFLIHISSPAYDNPHRVCIHGRIPPAWRRLGSAAHIVAGMGPATRFRFAFTHGERQMPGCQRTFCRRSEVRQPATSMRRRDQQCAPRRISERGTPPARSRGAVYAERCGKPLLSGMARRADFRRGRDVWGQFDNLQVPAAASLSKNLTYEKKDVVSGDPYAIPGRATSRRCQKAID
jgi:hypothetical protein